MQKIFCWSWIVILFIGCGSKYDDSRMAPATAQKADMADEAGGEAAADDEAQQVDEGVERKIIYEGRVSLVVEEFETLETAIPDLVKQYAGYLKEANINRTEGRRRSGRWVVRIPAAKFGDFVMEVSDLGIAEQQEQTAQDVTMEYLDLEARIKSKKQLEERILKLLEEREGKLSDVVEAERELARVRSEIESMEGQLRYLKNRTSFSTVTIDAREEQDYIPEAAPDFAGQISKAWQESVRSLKVAGQNLVIAFVAFVPWIIPVSVAIGLVVFATKRVRRKLGSEKATSPK